MKVFKSVFVLAGAMVFVGCGEQDLTGLVENAEQQPKEKTEQIETGESYLTQVEEEAVQEKKELELSEEGRQRMDEIKEFRTNLRSEVHALCGVTNDPFEVIKAEIIPIRDNVELDRSQKIEAIKAVHDNYKADLEAHKEIMQTCKSNNADSLEAIKSRGQALASACGLPDKKPRKHFGKRGKGGKKGKKGGLFLTEGGERPQINEETLLSDTCTQALGQ